MITEHDLCNLLIEHAKEHGFEIYPEQSGWDIILKYRNVLIGIQAKLIVDIHALYQCLQYDNVHFRCLLFDNYPKKYNRDYPEILWQLKIVQLFGGEHYRERNKIGVGVRTDLELRINPYDLWHYRLHPKKLAYIPPFEPELDAGVRSPKVVSPYKVACVRLEIMYDKLGCVHQKDALVCGLERIPRQFFYYNWDNRCWQIIENNRPSKQWDYVYKGLMENG